MQEFVSHLRPVLILDSESPPGSKSRATHAMSKFNKRAQEAVRHVRTHLSNGSSTAGSTLSGTDPLVIAHGLAMFSWVILFSLESLFILNGNRQLHMCIGVAGAVLAGIMVILGSATGTLSARNPVPYQMLGGNRFFLATLLGEMVCLGTLVATAVIYRRRAEIHRPMRLQASLMFKPPLYVMGPRLALGALFLVLHWGMTRVLIDGLDSAISPWSLRPSFWS